MSRSGTKAAVRPGWVPTVTGERIMVALEHARELRTIAVIYGGAGLGKTSTFTHAATMHPHTWIVPQSPATATPSACLDEIMNVLGVVPRPGMGAAGMRRCLVDELRDSGGLIILDEAQHLQFNALETVRSVADVAPVGLVLAGNETVFSRMGGASRAPAYAQLFSRVAVRLHLARPVKADVEALAEAWGVAGKPERAFLWRLGQTAGALRIVSTTLNLAASMAEGAGAVLSLEHLQGAWARLGGGDA